jgi:hypothetical protein
VLGGAVERELRRLGKSEAELETKPEAPVLNDRGGRCGQKKLWRIGGVAGGAARVGQASRFAQPLVEAGP